MAKKFTEMSAAELDAETRKYDESSDRSEFTEAPSREHIAMMDQLAKDRGLKPAPKRRGRGRPKLGKTGTTTLSISLEKSLASKVDKYARSHKTNRSAVVAEALAKLLAV